MSNVLGILNYKLELKYPNILLTLEKLMLSSVEL